MIRVTGVQTATKLTLTANTATPLSLAALPYPRTTVTIKNSTGAVLYVGGAGVTAAQGFPLAADERLTMDSGGGLYGLSVAGGDVHLLEGS